MIINALIASIVKQHFVFVQKIQEDSRCDPLVAIGKAVILGHKIQQIRRLFLQGRICLLPRKGLIDVPNAALKGIVLFVSEQC